MNYQVSSDQMEKAANLAARHLFEYCREQNLHYLVTGSSGGLDSAATLGLAAIACQMAAREDYPLYSVGLIMPCHSNPEAERLGRMAIERFAAREIRIDLTEVFDHIYTNIIEKTNAQVMNIMSETGSFVNAEDFNWSEKIAQGNIKARLRMMLGTYHVARMLSTGIVLSTDNLSEFWMAFWTICGDVGDYGMIQQMLKGLELYELAAHLGVPEGIRQAKPDDGLSIGNGDEDQLGADYPTIDKIMIALIQHGFDPDGSRDQLINLPIIEGIQPKIVQSIASRCLNGAFKRHGTIILSREDLGLPSIKEIKL